MAPKDPQYIPLSQHDTEEGKSPSYNYPADDDEPLSPLTTQLEWKSNAVTNTIRRWERVVRGILLLLSVVFFTFWIASVGMRKCTYIEKYSPANEAIEYIERVKYKGALNFTTPWRGDESGNPGPDIDAAWRRISTDVKPVCVTAEQLHKMGLVPTATTVKLPGGGYLASLEIPHHLQCLDMLRKATYREHYQSFDSAFHIEGNVLMNQLDSCVELLRQALMCYPDINMVPYYWVHGRNAPASDSNTIHRCKDFDRILNWATRKAVDISRISSFHMEKRGDGGTSGI